MNYSTALTLATLLIASVHLHGQNKIDSLKNILITAKDTARAQALTDLAKELSYTNPQESEKLATQAITLSKDIDYHRGTAQAYYVLSVLHDLLGNYQKAAESALAGIEIVLKYESIDSDQEIYSSLLSGVGTAYYHQSKYNEALTYYFNALTVSPNSKKLTMTANNGIGLIYHDLQELDKALTYYTKSFELAKDIKHNRNAGRTANNIGIIYEEKKDFTAAIKYYEIALRYKFAANDEHGIGSTYGNLGNTYSRLGDFSNALRYLDLSEAIRLKLKDKLGLLNVQVAKTNILVQLKRYKEAELIAKKSLALLDSLDTSEPKAMVFGKLYQLYENQGKYKEALEWHIRKTQVEDSLFAAEKNKQALDIEAKYETDKKEQTIKLLESEKKNQLVWRYILIGGIFMTGLIYFLQRSRTKKAKELLLVQQKFNDKLKETDLLKSRFYANISHEFRTPLSLIIAPIEEKLTTPKLSAHDKTTFELVKRNANRLLDLVNQLLDLSKLEVGKMQLLIQEGNLQEFLTTIGASFESLAENKKINFSTKVDIKHPLAWFDGDKLEKIMNNLLFNAFKFTPADGSVDLTIRAEYETSDLEIRINDTGSGISKEDLPHVFSPFYQSHHTIEDGTPGTGLGLSLVHELLKLHNGTIHIESEENRGTSIFVTIPIRKEKFLGSVISYSPAKSTSPTHKSTFESIEYFENEIEENYEESVLVIEDNADLRHFISSCIHNQFKVLLAENGEEGFRMAIDNTPDLIISDVMMPKMNGIELTSKIKTDERTSHIPVILLTAKSTLESKLEGLETGADDYIAKPFSTEELRVRIGNLIEQRKRLAAKYSSSIFEKPKEKVESSLDEKFVQKAKAIVEKYLSDSSFSVEKMAEEMNLSRSQLFRKLKAVAGLSPNELINDIRLQKAAELIISKADSLSQIGYIVGYNDQSYFSKRFRKKFGKSPTEFSIN
jgi:signal transduction histidine kinase/DNA-binding response OmpR family regulator/Tfp pilus assembly protein PilF